MIDTELLDKFYNWLQEGDSIWEDRGLKDNAPEEANKAYAEYLEMMKVAREKGIDY
jgi:hypothetical protein